MSDIKLAPEVLVNNGVWEDYRMPVPGDSFTWYYTRNLTDIKFVVIHYTWTDPSGDDHRDIDAVANGHIRSNGWGGIGYHIVIGNEIHGDYAKAYYVGDVGTARAHAPNSKGVDGIPVNMGNKYSIGISFIKKGPPSREQINTIHEILKKFYFDDTRFPGLTGWDRTRVHRQWDATACPGDWDYSQLQSFHPAPIAQPAPVEVAPMPVPTPVIPVQEPVTVTGGIGSIGPAVEQVIEQPKEDPKMLDELTKKIETQNQEYLNLSEISKKQGSEIISLKELAQKKDEQITVLQTQVTDLTGQVQKALEGIKAIASERDDLKIKLADTQAKSTDITIQHGLLDGVKYKFAKLLAHNLKPDMYATVTWMVSLALIGGVDMAFDTTIRVFGLNPLMTLPIIGTIAGFRLTTKAWTTKFISNNLEKEVESLGIWAQDTEKQYEGNVAEGVLSNVIDTTQPNVAH